MLLELKSKDILQSNADEISCKFKIRMQVVPKCLFLNYFKTLQLQIFA